jgi:putative NADPH-quinone reductase
MTISTESRVLVLDGHPDEESLCGTLAVIAAEAAEARGATVKCCATIWVRACDNQDENR